MGTSTSIVKLDLISLILFSYFQNTHINLTIMKKLLYYFTLLLIVTSCKESAKKETVVEPEIITTTAKARIDSVLKSFVDAKNIAGVSALIFEKGEEVYYNAFGYADIAANKPMDRNTIVQIYSMTKPITGTALMTLYEEGKFKLDEPISKYIPEFANMTVYTGVDAKGNVLTEPLHREITIRDITRHTAGFPNRDDIPGLSKLFKDADASPLEMNETRYYIPEEDRDRFAKLYIRKDEGVLVQDTITYSNYTEHWPLTRGGSGLTSTLDNYMRFAQMLVHEGSLDTVQILKPETIKLMSTNQLADSITERSWLPTKGQVGFGIDFAVRVAPPKTPEENHGVVGEFYWDGAASTLFWVDPVNELTAVMFVQLFPYDQIGLHKQFRDAVYGPYPF